MPDEQPDIATTLSIDLTSLSDEKLADLSERNIMWLGTASGAQVEFLGEYERRGGQLELDEADIAILAHVASIASQLVHAALYDQMTDEPSNED